MFTCLNNEFIELRAINLDATFQVRLRKPTQFFRWQFTIRGNRKTFWYLLWKKQKLTDQIATQVLELCLSNISIIFVSFKCSYEALFWSTRLFSLPNWSVLYSSDVTCLTTWAVFFSYLNNLVQFLFQFLNFWIWGIHVSFLTNSSFSTMHAYKRNQSFDR